MQLSLKSDVNDLLFSNVFTILPIVLLEFVLQIYTLSSFCFSGLCAIGYLVCGLLCFDRFTARAFLSNDDPRITTAIPTPNNNRTNDHLGSVQCDGSVTTAQQSVTTDPVDRIQAW